MNPEDEQWLAIIHAVAGGAGGSVAMCLLYPLDHIRTRLQIQKTERTVEKRESWAHKSVHYKGMLDCAYQICRKEGWTSLYNGMQSGLIGIGFSTFVYFYWYNLLKRSCRKTFNTKSFTPWQNMAVASLSGVLNVFCTMPIWVVNTRMKLDSKRWKGTFDCMKDIFLTEGFKGLYKGLTASLILVSNPVIQFVVYEQCLQKIRAKKLGDTGIFFVGAFAKAIATLITYPYQVIKSRQQACEGHCDNVWDTIKKMWLGEGWSSFFRGMSTKMIQTVLTSAVMFVCYEKIVGSLIKAALFAKFAKAKKLRVAKQAAALVEAQSSVVASTAHPDPFWTFDLPADEHIIPSIT